MPSNRFRKHRIKRDYQPKDKKKLIVMAYMVSIHPKGSTRHGIATHAKTRKQEHADFGNLVNTLVEIDWLRKEAPISVSGHDNYFITDEGRKALNMAKELARDDHPLSSLDVFKDVLDL